jgi:hypothetical protein
VQRASLDGDAPSAVLARGRNGKIVTLDSAPGEGLTDLRVAGTTVYWKHGGAQKSADVAGS